MSESDDAPPLLVPLYQCPSCHFTDNKSAYTHERQRQHGGDTYRCPDCGTQVRIA